MPKKLRSPAPDRRKGASTPLRILLDSNVWRYIVDANAVGIIQRASRKSRNTLVVAPAVLFEAARTSNKSLRDILLEALARRSWKRLMPEAYSEAEELKNEIKRLRPEWLRPTPDLVLFRRLRHDWARARGGVWDRMRADAEPLQRIEAEMIQRTRDQAYALREDAAKALPPKWRSASMTKTMASFPFPVPGWNGQPVEMWRVDALNVFRAAMTLPHYATFDWLTGEVDLALMLFQSESLVKFWMHDVDLQRMPRYWLRWGFEFLQRMQRVTDGTPVDAQLGTYLIEADLMLSADKIMVLIAERCREDAPFRIAESKVVPGGTAAVASVLRAIEEGTP